MNTSHADSPKAVLSKTVSPSLYEDFLYLYRAILNYMQSIKGPRSSLEMIPGSSYTHVITTVLVQRTGVI